MRRRRHIVWVLATALVVVLGLVSRNGGVVPPVPRVASPPAPEAAPPPDRPAPPAAPASSAAPPVASAPAPIQPVFDLATVGHRAPSGEEDRFRTNDRFTADDLAHPERYFEAAEHVPELRRDEERRDALEYFVAYRARLAHDLRAAGRDVRKRTAIRTVIARYDAAIARLRNTN